MEIRKNHVLLIDLWKDLISEPDFDLDLVIVGMPGWGAENVVATLEGLAAFGSRILWFKNLSDAGLSWLYEHCLVVLYPSHYEGWGLPIVEALQHGRPVIASDRGAMPEAGFGAATLLDPDDRMAWQSAILGVCHGTSKVTAIKPEGLPNWDDTVVQVKNGLMDIIEDSMRNS